MLLSENDCDTFAIFHFKQIIKCLSELALKNKEPFCQCFQNNHRKISNANELITFIIDFVDPEPINQIEMRINCFAQSTSFIINDFGERDFMKTFFQVISSKDTRLEQLIDQCSNSFFFNSYFFGGLGEPLSQNNDSLSLKNRFIKKLSLYGTTQQNLSKHDRKTFSADTYFTKSGDCRSMQQATRDILVLLMRAYVIKETAGTNERVNQINTTILNVISHLPYPQNKALHRKTEDLEKKIAQMQVQQTLLEEKIDGLSKSN